MSAGRRPPQDSRIPQGAAQEMALAEPSHHAAFEDSVRDSLGQHANATALRAVGAAVAAVDPRARRIGTLFRLADRLVAEGVLEGSLGDPAVQRRLQKCAYIAQRMGAGLGYRFGFLESGAFSTGLAVDVYQRGAARGGAEPFGGDGRMAEAFLRLVRGRSDGWLRIATFAMRGEDAPAERAEFVEYVAWHDPGLDRELIGRVFDDVRSLAASGGRGSGP